jgi:hypothetical protein
MFRMNCIVVVIGLALVSATANAQQSGNAITGAVSDSSGAVLPGVTVEVSSPELIEKVRAVITDSEGRYLVVDLRPGAYTVTFQLPGFKTARRDRVDLSGDITATVNAVLEVGALEETITVTGQSPLVDVQSVKQQRGVDAEILASVPTARDIRSLTTLIPGMVSTGSSDVGGLNRGNASFVMHGGFQPEGRSQVDGFMVGGSGSGVASTYWADVANSQEVVITTSGHLGEAETAGAIINVIPRQGGNSLRGSLTGLAANQAFQGSNFTDALRAAGLRAPNSIQHVVELTGHLGGPVQKDRLWYLGAFNLRRQGETVASMWHNKNAYNPNSWTYDPDLSRQATSGRDDWSTSIRMTWQATPRNKFTLFGDRQYYCSGCDERGGSATTAPEASTLTSSPQALTAVSWVSPVTSRFLLDAGYQHGPNVDWGGREREVYDPSIISVQDQGGQIPGLTYRRPATWARNFQGVKSWRASASYVTGTHNLKAGLIGYRHCHCLYSQAGDLGVNYRVNSDAGINALGSGIPNLITMSIDRFNRDSHLIQHGIYLQDQWSFNRLTVQGALRYDHVWSSFPAVQVGPVRFLPQAINFPKTNGANLHDISPRVGAAYDLFGTAKTALKFELGRYLMPAAGSSYLGTSLAPVGHLAGSGGALGQNNSSRITTTRSWNDRFYPVGDPRRDNMVPDCDLLDPLPNTECGRMANENFGRNVIETHYDPNITKGWFNRPTDWNLGVSVQHEIKTGLSATVGYFRRWWNNAIVIDNRAVGPQDFQPYSIVAPVDQRLPNGGGYVINDLWDITEAKFGVNDALVTSADQFGRYIRYWQGVDITITARTARLRIQGGTSTGRAVEDNCDVTPKLENPSMRFCRTTEPMLNRIRGLATYTVPKLEFLVSGTYQSNPGPALAANFAATNALISPTLGRNLSGQRANTPINLVEPNTVYGDRINQLDFRVAKVLRLGNARTQFGFDLYNALNTDTPETYNETYTLARWLTPTSVLRARFAKVSAQIDF